MIPANTGVNSPIVEEETILDENGLLDVWATGDEAEGGRRGWIKLSGIGNEIAKVFIQERVVRLHAKLEFVPAMTGSNGALEIALAKPVVLKDCDWRGGR